MEVQVRGVHFAEQKGAGTPITVRDPVLRD